MQTLHSSGSYQFSNHPTSMFVIKRGSRGKEPVKLDKITDRIKFLCKGLSSKVDPLAITIQTVQNIHDGITTEELDLISAKIAEQMKTNHPDYGILAGRILVSNLHKTTPKSFSQCMRDIGDALQIKSESHYKFIEDNAAALDNMIIHENDYNVDYFGFKTLEQGYLNKIGEHVHDRPQYVFMRVAIAIYKDYSTEKSVVLENIKVCYKALSQMYFTHATPSLFNACTRNQQMNSCFLLGTDDSIEGIMKNLSHASFISKWAGGIGIHMSNIRCEGATIHGTCGRSSGLPKQLKMYNAAALCWDQGGKRKGAFAIYLELWHGDILKVLEMKLQNGSDEERARDLFYAVWVSDLFMKRMREDKPWSLFSEDSAPGLSEAYDGMPVCTVCNHSDAGRDWTEIVGGVTKPADSKLRVGTIRCPNGECKFKRTDVFTQLYEKYEREGRAIRQVRARTIVDAICAVQRESGTPYVCFKDHVNRRSNQSNIGTVKSSNLCAEIMEWSSARSYACCTLASINLRKFLVRDDSATATNGLEIDHDKLHDMVRLITRNLDIIIDVNKYPVNECEENSVKYRPIGIGVQGLADVFCEMRVPFLSNIAKTVDLEIAETIYHAAVTESIERSKQLGPYSKFAGSPASQGKFQFDLWKENLEYIGNPVAMPVPISGRYAWDDLRSDMVKHGMRNSLLVAYMPTVSTSQILGNNESFEPYPGNIYTKTTLSGKFTITNNTMLRHLIDLGLWNDTVKAKVVNNNGSIQDIEEIPKEIREIYKTVWEMPQKEIMRRCALRSAFVDQSLSLNIHVRDNSNAVLRSIFETGYDLGLKTGSYYIRTPPASKALKNNIAETKVRDEAKPKDPKEEFRQKAEEAMKNADVNRENDDDEGGACPIGCQSCSA